MSKTTPVRWWRDALPQVDGWWLHCLLAEREPEMAAVVEPFREIILAGPPAPVPIEPIRPLDFDDFLLGAVAFGLLRDATPIEMRFSTTDKLPPDRNMLRWWGGGTDFDLRPMPPHHRGMHRPARRLALRTDTLRTLTTLELAQAAGGERPTAAWWTCAAMRAGTTSEADGAGPCPGEYSWTCSP